MDVRSSGLALFVAPFKGHLGVIGEEEKEEGDLK